MARRPGSVLCGVMVASLAALPACSDSNRPIGRGDRLASDVNAPAMLPSTDVDAASADSPFAPLDAQYGPLTDGYVPLAVCAKCACARTTFCYGGSAYSSFSGACDQTASTTLDVGCHAIPAGCAAAPDCVCLLQALAPQMPCYAACADNQNGEFAIYCPP